MKLLSAALVSLFLAGHVFAGGKVKTASYEDFINSIDTSPIDYIFELFEKYDIVIMGERDHRDITQYELVGKVITDERFGPVSDVMCEVGSNNFTERVNQLICRSYVCRKDFEIAAMDFIKDMSYMALWNKTNFLCLLSLMNELNTIVRPADPVRLTLLDVPFNWRTDSIRSHGGYRDFYRRTMPRRERIMADNFIESFGASKKGKALVILNGPHSYRGYKNRYSRETTAQYLFEAFEGRVANVFINWTYLSASENDNRDRLIDRGNWDTAFGKCGYKEIGFDMEGSPFGETKFRDMIRPGGSVKYKDVYTGFVYYKNPLQWIESTGFPHDFSGEFYREYIDRLTVIKGKRDEEKYRSSYYKACKPNTFPIYRDNKRIKRKLERYR